MYIVGYSLVALIVLVGAILAICVKDLVIAASVLGLGSAALAMMFFALNVPYAGGFELSVGAGLVSVLFIVAISLTSSMGIFKKNDPVQKEIPPEAQRTDLRRRDL
ncbi:MAG: hypothetical protein JXA33_24320 [Anaerolineae bacterium]|nr:hypothetical protein [Anaerolineae bacterium]